eukprot:6536708-Alexandrium_andersonii.AAC.1
MGKGLRGMRIGGLRIWRLRVGDFATSDPLKARLRGLIRNLREKCHRTHPSGASRVNFEAVLGSEQFQVRAPEAMLHFYAWQTAD